MVVERLINAQIKEFPFISAHAIAPVLRTIVSINRKLLLLTHIGTLLEDYNQIVEKVKRKTEFRMIENWKVLSPDFSIPIPLTAAHRTLSFSEKLWADLKWVAKERAGEKTDPKGLLKTIQKLVDYYKASVR